MSVDNVADSAAGAPTASHSAGPLLDVRNLRTYFKTPFGMVRAVDGVSAQLRHGETLGVVGESGSGKSIFVRSIMNLLPGERRSSARTRR